MSEERFIDKEKLRLEKYDPFRVILDDIKAKVLTKSSSEMWPSAVLNVRHAIKSSQRANIISTETAEFYKYYGEQVMDLLMTEARHKPKSTEMDHTTRVDRVVEAIHKISAIFSKDEVVELEPRNIQYLSFEQLCQMSDRFKVGTKQDEQGNDRKYFYVYSKRKEKWYEYPVPNTDKVLHKGGTGRTILKTLYCSDQDLVESELPPNDYDYIAIKCQEAKDDLKGLRVDLGGIEEVNEIDLERLMNSRDLDLNNAFLGKDGLVFDESAKKSAESGKISIVSAEREIYGSEVFFYEGIRLIKNRGIMRLIKTLAECKAGSFDFLPLNQQLDLGIYWLILAKRFSTKENFPLFMDRMFELEKQMNQVGKEETNIYQVLDRIHQKYSFYNFDAKLDDEGLARWIGNKLIKQIDKKYRDKYKIPSLLDLKRQDNDTVPYEVSLKEYHPDPVRLKEIETGWSAFLDRCSRRNADYLDQSLDSVDDA